MEYPNSGVLWTSTRKSNDRAPDMYGDITIDIDLLEELLDDAEEGQDSIKIKLDGWRKKDRSGNAMVSIKVNTYKKPDQEQSQDNGKDPWDD
jgi:hypothetical protein